MKTSKYYGVCFEDVYRTSSQLKSNKKWKSYVFVNNKTVTIGRFETELEAAKAVDKKLISLGMTDKLNLFKPI